MTTFDLNGTTITTSGNHPHLMAALRDELGVISPKDGCAPSGQCGCCTVLVDGRARVACQTSMERAEGAQVVTLEGFNASERDLYATTFAAHGALQCGFCTPGFVLASKAFLDKNPNPTPEEIERGLGGNLCRCGTYVGVRKAVMDAARALKGGPLYG